VCVEVYICIRPPWMMEGGLRGRGRFVCPQGKGGKKTASSALDGVDGRMGRDGRTGWVLRVVVAVEGRGWG
jgi:hypothetical protein